MANYKENDENSNGCGYGCLGCLLSPITLPVILLIICIALLLLLLAVVIVVPAFLYLILAAIFCILRSIIGAFEDDSDAKESGAFVLHSIIISIIYALLPTVMFCLNVWGENTLPSNVADWSCSFYAVNWFSFIAGFVYISTLNVGILITDILNKFGNAYTDKSRWITAYIAVVAQLTFASFLIKTSIEKGVFVDEYLSIAFVPQIIVVVCLFIIIGIFNMITFKIRIKNLFREGDLLYERGQYKNALIKYRKAHELVYTPYYFYAIGMVYYAQQDYNKAIYNLKKFFSMQKQPEVCIVLADIFKERNSFDEGISWYNTLLGMFDKNSEEYKKYMQQKREYFKSVEDKRAKIKQENIESEIKQLKKNLNDALMSKRYSTALQIAEKIVKLAPENSDYKIELENVQKLYDEAKEKIEQLCNQAKTFAKENNYQKAIDLISEAKSMATRLGEDISEYLALWKKYNKKMKMIEAEDVYIRAKQYFEDENYTSALCEIKKAIKLNPSSKTYIDFKDKIDFEINKNETEKKFQNYYEKALNEYNNGNLSEASYFIDQALYLRPNNIEVKELSNRISTGKIDIMNCTKNALLALDFINEEQAENIIHARDEGVMWYDYQKFSEQFGIMPHQWVDVEEKIAFPLKQANKYGRKLDI